MAPLKGPQPHSVSNSNFFKTEEFRLLEKKPEESGEIYFQYGTHSLTRMGAGPHYYELSQLSRITKSNPENDLWPFSKHRK